MGIHATRKHTYPVKASVLIEIVVLCSSLLGNRITGPIPKELWNIATLTDLVLEANNFSGDSARVLEGIEKLLPTSLANLTSLKDFRISDNNFTGRIPDFISNWTQLEKLDLSFNMLEGHLQSIPSKIENADFISGAVPLCLKDFDCPKPCKSAILCKFYINCGGEEVTLDVNGTHRATTFTEDKDPGGASRYFPSRDRWAFSSTGNFLDKR
ncbi:putative leucine-rich repeat receptor-like serine/threonine-protein kinase [Cinnamomum micranthum f. kanehirae]|uniref:Putative leucine-rich repeat receptor-like serine/threonine-protein kinase n=1 Tax=Cinnamomum micranthum f. kanehirae TaxID=337451 RepID=A0A443PZR2_9MAGN|nr:putative leucine-rich repeat receptor-like serine/threonine-protein kinase [Cinnamomum micranthum f. kanehirae]